MTVASTPYPDPSQFDPKSPYYDAASKREAPRWLLVDVQVLHKTRNLTPCPSCAPMASWKTWWCCARATACPSRRSSRSTGESSVNFSATQRFEANCG